MTDALLSIGEKRMNRITIVYMTGCPYCAMARKAVEKLGLEDRVEWVNENTEPDKIRNLDYYYVPSIFKDGVKLFEAHPGDSYEKIEAAVKAAF